MSSIVLGTVGSIVGGPIGGAVLSNLGNWVGSSKNLTPQRREEDTRSSKEMDYQLAFQQVSSYGKMIPILYGTHRMAGNIIWAAASGDKKSICVAIALCEGVIDSVIHIWANDILLDTWNVTWRLYHGTEAQMPDPLIESIEGMGNVPSYRGLAYVVIEYLCLDAFHHHLPHFTFEVKRQLKAEEHEGLSTEEMIHSMVMIPGAGEQVYDTLPHYKVMGENIAGKFIPQGTQHVVNMHNRSQKANVLVALDQLKETCPNVEWISVVVTWFGTDMNIATCNILPGVEYKGNTTTLPEAWKVGGYTRSTAHMITLDENKSPLYGGTPQDGSVIRLCEELRRRGYKILFTPMFFMDVLGKPWRGKVTGEGASVHQFFNKNTGYNNFISHYAHLMKDRVDGFAIGSEMIGITSIRQDNVSESEQFPGVSALVNLAHNVRKIMGKTTLLTYASDWSEYHHTEGGWYNLDPLWACDAIDRVGIDAYFPLIERAEDQYDVKKIMKGWESGWHYSYYTKNGLFDGKRLPISPEYALKNIKYWWNNVHVNPNGKHTAWSPGMKKIWFTEYGFPSVDGAASQPNVFYDPKSQEGGLPYLSRGHMDIHAQRTAILGTEIFWKNSPMVERLFLWTWDARPFPFWPDFIPVWADGYAWSKGHWVQGKFGVSGLANIVADITKNAGLAHCDTTRLKGIVEGLLISQLLPARQWIEILQQAYFFDAIVSENRLKYIMRSENIPTDVREEDLLVIEEKESSREALTITRLEESELPRHIEMSFYNPHDDYHIATEHAKRAAHSMSRHVYIKLPLVFSPMRAKYIAHALLYEAWMSRIYYHFALPASYAFFEPGDIIHLVRTSSKEKMRIVHILFDSVGGSFEVQAVREEPAMYKDSLMGTSCRILPDNFVPSIPKKIPDTIFWIFELPAMFYNKEETKAGVLYGAACGTEIGWDGGEVLLIDDNSLEEDEVVAEMHNASVMGYVSDERRNGTGSEITLIVSLLHGKLQNILRKDQKYFALIKKEIVSFEKITFIAPYKYEIIPIRALFNSVKTATLLGEKFILLDENIVKIEKNFEDKKKLLTFKAISKGQNRKEGKDLTYQFDSK